MGKPGNPNWVKGKSGNPAGGKPGKYRRLLEKALAADTKKHGTSLLVHAVKTARTDSTVLNAILKKILPDLKSIEAKLDTESPFRLILEYAPTADKPKDNKTGKESKELRNPDKCAFSSVGPDGKPLTIPASGKTKTLRAMSEERKANAISTAKTDKPRRVATINTKDIDNK